MDSLLAEINSKRKALTELDGAAAGEPSKKYMRRADIERAKEEEESRKRAELKAAEEAKSQATRASKMRREAELARKASLQRLSSPSSSTGTPEPTGQGSSGETFNISNEECIRRLRAKGQPIRLFGETDKERRLRLRALELLEKTGGTSSQGFNDFNKLMKDMESGYEAREEEKKSRAMHMLAEERDRQGREGSEGGGGGTPGAMDEKRAREEQRRKVADKVLDLDLIRSDPQKLYPIMYYALKGVLKEWEEWMEDRPEDIKRSTQGKLALATQVSSAQNLKPLFKQIRSRDMPDDVLRCMSEIVHHMQMRQYQKANDAYLRLSIGNAAWPIGVTSVGIHERSAREKIAQDVIGHVLNDEVSRKWIQAVKRLLTFSQTVRPPTDLSQMMG